MQEITLNEAQLKVDEWISTIGVKYFGELTNLGILMEEVGELSKHLVRIYGEQSYREEIHPRSKKQQEEVLGDEMADVLWVLICLANQTGINLNEALIKNIKKKSERDSLRHRQNPKLK